MSGKDLFLMVVMCLICVVYVKYINDPLVQISVDLLG